MSDENDDDLSIVFPPIFPELLVDHDMPPVRSGCLSSIDSFISDEANEGMMWLMQTLDNIIDKDNHKSRRKARGAKYMLRLLGAFADDYHTVAHELSDMTKLAEKSSATVKKLIQLDTVQSNDIKLLLRENETLRSMVELSGGTLPPRSVDPELDPSELN